MAGGVTVTAQSGNEVKVEWSGWSWTEGSSLTLWRSTSAITNPPTGLSDDKIIATGLSGNSGNYTDYGTSPSTTYYYVISDGTLYGQASSITTPAKGEMESDYVPANMNHINEDAILVNAQNSKGSTRLAPLPVSDSADYLTVIVLESSAALTDKAINDMILTNASITAGQLVAYMELKPVTGYDQTFSGNVQVKYVAES